MGDRHHLRSSEFLGEKDFLSVDVVEQAEVVHFLDGFDHFVGVVEGHGKTAGAETTGRMELAEGENLLGEGGE